RVDVTRLDLGVATRPSARLHVTARYRYHDRDDETPRDLYRLVRGDSEQQLAAELARINRPYSLTEHRLGLDVAYRVTRGVRVQAGYSYLDQRRDLSEVDGSDEHTFKAGLRLVRIEPLVLSIDYVHARRSVGEYVGNRPLAATRVPG